MWGENLLSRYIIVCLSISCAYMKETHFQDIGEIGRDFQKSIPDYLSFRKNCPLCSRMRRRRKKKLFSLRVFIAKTLQALFCERIIIILFPPPGRVQAASRGSLRIRERGGISFFLFCSLSLSLLFFLYPNAV